MDRGDGVYGDALALIEEDAEIELGARVAGIGELLPFAEGGGEVAALVGLPAFLETGPRRRRREAGRQDRQQAEEGNKSHAVLPIS